MMARLDFALVNDLVEAFPGGKWKRLDGTRLQCAERANGSSRTWKELEHVKERGGNYAFLFPKVLFAQDREIQLDGPAGAKLPFRFTASDFETIDGLVVAYVGKAANLHQRFQWHFSAANINTGAQVQYGLVKSGVSPDREAAIRLMLEQAVIVYLELHGDENVANRDLLELKLCARFGPPFNIKAER